MKKALVYLVLLIYISSALALTGDGEPWHALQQVSTDASGSTSVDADASGRVDSADDLTCTGGNCIQAAEIQDNQISSSHLTANSVTSGKIVDGTILAADLEDNGQTELDGQLLAYDSGTGGFSWTSISGVTGSGTTNFLPIWTGSSTLGDSSIEEREGNIYLFDNTELLWGSAGDGITESSNSMHTMSRNILRFYADTNSNTAGSEIEFYTNVAEGTTTNPKLSINSDGSVGIGTASPAGMLDVQGSLVVDNLNDGGTSALYVTRLGATDQGLKVYADDRNLYMRYIEDSGESLPGTVHFINELAGSTSYEYMTALYDGEVVFPQRVGIGVSSPGYALDVYSADGNVADLWAAGSSAYVYIGAGSYSGAGIAFEYPDLVIRNYEAVSTSDIHFKNNGGATTVMTLADSGYVGIGDATPDALLDLKVNNPNFIIFDRTANGNINTQFTAGVSYASVNQDHFFIGDTGLNEHLVVRDDGDIIVPQGAICIRNDGNVDCSSGAGALNAETSSGSAVWAVASSEHGVYGETSSNSGFSGVAGTTNGGTDSSGVNGLVMYGSGSPKAVRASIYDIGDRHQQGPAYGFYAASGRNYFYGYTGFNDETPEYQLDVVGKAHFSQDDGVGMFGTDSDISVGRVPTTTNSDTADKASIQFHNAGQSEARMGLFHRNSRHTLFFHNTQTATDLMVDGGYRTDSSIDVAERFAATSDLVPGQVACFDANSEQHVTKCDKANGLVAGIVSTNPGIVLGDGDLDQPENKTNSEIIALMGRVPVIVTSKNGDISVGDHVQVGNEYAVKLGTSGLSLGRVLTDPDWSDERCPLIESENIVWPQDDGKNTEKPCFRIEDAAGEYYVGKVMLFADMEQWQPSEELAQLRNTNEALLEIVCKDHPGEDVCQ